MPPDDELPSLGAHTSGTVTVQASRFAAGVDNLSAEVEGFVALEAETASLHLKHKGGWSPVSGSLAPYLTTPPFEATLNLNLDGVALSFVSNASFAPRVELVPKTTGFAALTAHPAIGAPFGPTIRLSLEQSTFEHEPQWNVTLASGLKIGGESDFAPPLLAVEGLLSGEGASLDLLRLDVSTAERWAPLRTVLPELAVPALHGTLILDLEGDQLDLSVRNVQAIRGSDPFGMFDLSECYLSVATTINLTAVNRTHIVEGCDICQGQEVKRNASAGHMCVSANGTFLADSNDPTYPLSHADEATCLAYESGSAWQPYSCEDAAEWWRTYPNAARGEEAVAGDDACARVSAFYEWGGYSHGCCIDPANATDGGEWDLPSLRAAMSCDAVIGGSNGARVRDRTPVSS